MDFAEEAKQLWPVSSIFSAPLLLSDRNSNNDSRKIGPLFFNPSPKTLTHFTISPSLYSPTNTFSPFPYVSLYKFLKTSCNSSILASTSYSIASSTLGPQISKAQLVHNVLQMMKCSGPGRVLLFFPAGQNLDQVGFVLLAVEGGRIGVKFSGAGIGLNFRISRILVQKVDDCLSGDFGFLLVCTMYSVYWYVVRLGLNSDKPKLNFLGSKCFRSSAVVHACWSPHIPEECVVLLENGKLFLFDLESCYGSVSLINVFKGKYLRVRWDDYLDVQGEGSWLSCELSWHPRVLVVAHSTAVFLVDLRSEGCKVQCLLRMSMLPNGSFVEENDRFVAFSRAGPDGFYYTVASNSFLFLCDVRNPLMPVLQWNHSIDNPAYITVVKLSKLRSNSKNDEYTWASENGHCILMGSFWNCEFSLFCYGPSTRTCAASEISRFCKSLYAWELPSELLLASCYCYCGSCLVKEEFSKDSLPEWIDWQQKKDIVLGFCILDEYLSVELFEPENFGGFTVIRLMSSGDLVLQRTGDEEYKFSKQFYFLKLEYLYANLNDKLGRVLMNKKKETSGNPLKVSSNPEFHQDICQKLKACGINKIRSSADISYAVRDIVCPMNMMEIALVSMWSSLPPILLRLGFLTYVDLCNITGSQKNLSLQFLDVPHQPQLPPFTFRNPSHCSNNWPRKMQHDNALLGPAVPIHFLVTYNKLYIEKEAGRESANRLLELECNKVTQMVDKVVRDSAYEDLSNDRELGVSLANDKDDMCNGSQGGARFSLYEPVSFSNKISNVDPPTSASSTFENQNYSTFLSRCNPTEVYSNDKVDVKKPEAIDAICPTGLKFSDCAIGQLPAEFKYLFGQQKKFKKSFTAKSLSTLLWKHSRYPLHLELDDPFLDFSGFWSMLERSSEMEVFYASFRVSLLFVSGLTFAPLSSDFFLPIAAAAGKI
ncbi:hypothetical protein POM88_011887 [Heracleum sosnowskyi]|uniref:TAF1C beta-propeller domain-containing protein n=1 Tax=Heracleum sosnowskyi TaxID=360622 RepID=A0AAD8IXX4_9APIA|nr:hypothetical protein POM88_011887 [Heracleum sosnowskyi]